MALSFGISSVVPREVKNAWAATTRQAYGCSREVLPAPQERTPRSCCLPSAWTRGLLIAFPRIFFRIYPESRIERVWQDTSFLIRLCRDDSFPLTLWVDCL
jgi:hypothetical protein